MQTRDINQLHAQSMENLHSIRRTLVETEQIGARTAEQLAIDREKLLNINKSLDEVDNKLSFSKRILKKISRRDDKTKIIVGSSAAVITAGVITTAVMLKK